MKKFDENYILLKGLYLDAKEGITEVSEKTLDELKSYIEELISFLEKGDLNLEKVQNELDKMTNKINELDEKEDYFIETVERELIAEDIEYILKWFNIDLDIEDALEMREW